MTERFFVSDTIEADLEPVDEDGNVEDVSLDGFDWSEQHRVVIENAPWADAFGTDEFYRFESTVARPIPQQYHLPADRVPDGVADGDGPVTVTLKKHPEDLQSSQWRLDNAPYTLGHPPKRIVTDGEEVRGFWRHPDYVHNDDEPDEQRLRLYVPTNDSEARQFLEDNQSVSVGFHADFEWTVADDDPHADSIDGYQRNFHYDHVAGVSHGRCSTEDGCEIALGDSVQADSAADGDVPAAHGGCTPEACSCGLHTNETDVDDDTTDSMTDDPDNDIDPDDPTPTIDVGSLSVEAVRDRHAAIDKALTEKEDEIEELEDQIDAVKSDHEDLKSAVEDFEHGERTPKVALVDDITDLTDHWDEEDLLDEDRETLEDRLDLAEDMATSATTIGDNTDDPDTSEATTDSPDEKELAPGVVDLSETA